MALYGPKNLQAKFLLGLGTIVLLLGLFFASSLYFHLSSLLDSQVQDKANLVLNQVNAVQSYVRETLRPKMFSTLPEDEFIIEAMSSSFISRAVMDRLDMTHTEYHYRRVAENARNPLFEINENERELLRFFRAHPEEDSWEGYKRVKGLEYFVKARPVVFKDSCLTCHGVPKDSPRVLLERYGADRGFGHKPGGVDGLVLIGIPVQKEVHAIREATIGYAVLYGGGMLIFFALVQIFFNRLIVHNLKRLTEKFHSLFRNEAEMGVIEKLEQGDEIEEIVQGLEELGDHLHAVQNQLREHSENMEQMVDIRTEELRFEVDERNADVGLFVQLLDGLNKSNSRRQMWRYALPILGQRFGVESIGFVCALASQSYYNWPDAENRPELPEDWKTILTEVKPRFATRKAFIPVGSSYSSAEGILCITWAEGKRITDQDRNVLRALGQQMGIAMENLAALNNLLRQKDMLQIVVEGIRDPLLLVSGKCTVVLANAAARSLAASFGGDENDVSCSGLFSPGSPLSDCPLKKHLERGEAASGEITAEDGRCFFMSVFPVAGGSEEAGRAVVYIRDVTKEKQMLSSMQQSEKLATVGQLAAGLAHEMNNPLGVIKCYAELLKNAGEGQDVEGDAQVILKHASQAQNVLQNLLNFARPKQAEPASLDIGKVVRDVIGIFRTRAGKQGVEVTRDVADNLPHIIANEQSVEQILTNLLNNALDEVEPNTGRITVQAAMSNTPDHIVIRVRDNGPGIGKDDIKKLFDPFFTTKEVGKGTGLGLAVVYGLVQEMGGTIDIASDGGAVFSVHLPVEDGSATADGEQA